MSRSDDSPLGRWSRRKAAARRGAEEAAPRTEAPPPEAVAEPAAPEPEKTDAELLEELGLPDPDTLGRGDDFSAFMARTVPARLRRRALRKLWTTDPTLAALDGLVDYDDDFRAMAAAGGAVKTSYEVGRGFLGAARDAAEKLAEDGPASPEAPPEEAPPPEAAEREPEPAPPAVESRPEPAERPRRSPRRMTFAFDDAPEAAPNAGAAPGADGPSSSAGRKTPGQA